MAYACPVCGAPQADGEHLADHLALTAVLHGGDHEDWLDEHAPGWEETAPDALGATAVEHADEVDGEAGEGREPARPDALDAGARPEAPGGLDPETRRAVEEAMEMTREHLADEDDEE